MLRADFRPADSCAFEPRLFYQRTCEMPLGPFKSASCGRILKRLLFFAAHIEFLHSAPSFPIGISSKFKLRSRNNGIRKGVNRASVPKIARMNDFFCNASAFNNGDAFQHLFYLPAVCTCIHCNRTADRARDTRCPFKPHKSLGDGRLCSRAEQCSRSAFQPCSVKPDARHARTDSDEQSLNSAVGNEKIAAVADNIHRVIAAPRRRKHCAKLVRILRLRKKSYGTSDAESCEFPRPNIPPERQISESPCKHIVFFH